MRSESICILICLLSAHSSNGQLKPEDLEIPAISKMEEAAQAFSHSLKFRTNQITNYKRMIKDFNELSKFVTMKSRQGDQLNNDFNSRIAKILHDKKGALKKLRDKAKFIDDKYTYRTKINDFDYKNIRTINNTLLALNSTFSTVVPIDINNSFVQVPTNIYSKRTDVLNMALSTETLDGIFRDNEYNGTDPSLLYQYYGHSSGVFRVFPGNMNGFHGNVDMFDCRGRPWYRTAASSPIDMVILLDTSGSMVGSNIGIAQITIKALIDTLSENDYFNVIMANESAHNISCAKYLIQATARNKWYMKEAINTNISIPQKIFNISAGLTMAFEMFDAAATYNRTYTANCNRVIIVITDAVEGTYKDAGQEVFAKLNKGKGVRVFAYLIGRVVNPADRACKEMACDNRGHFYAIETMNNIWNTIWKYLEVMSRPVAQTPDATETVHYTPAYLDASGNGMIVSVSMGVYNARNLTGVVGADISVQTLKEQVSHRKLGSFGRGFVINSNGFIILHPRFREQTGYLPPPANVYVSDIERVINFNDTDDLQLAMQQRESDQLRLEVYWTYDSNRRLLQDNVTYSFHPVNLTRFSSAVAISDIDARYFFVNKNMSAEEFDESLKAFYIYDPVNKTENYTQNNFTYVSVSPWRYCQLKAVPSHLEAETPKSRVYFPTAAELEDYLLMNSKDSKIPADCDQTLVRSLLVTAATLHGVVSETWDEWTPDPLDIYPPFSAVYAATSAGYARYFTHTNGSWPYDRDVHHTPVWQHSLANPDREVLVSTFGNNLTYLEVTASAWLPDTDTGEKVLAAISGVKMHVLEFSKFFKNATDKIEFDCSDNETFVCAVVDENAFIVVSNQHLGAIGKFLGELQGPLMDHLSNVNVSVFKKTVLYDTQAQCKQPLVYDGAASFLLTPARLIIDGIGLVLRTTWFVLVNVFLFFSSLLTTEPAHAQTIPMKNYSCTKTQVFYQYQQHMWLIEKKKDERKTRFKYRRLVDCEKGKKQEWGLAPIPDTNLVFIVASQPSPKCRQKSRGEEIVQMKLCEEPEPYRNTAANRCYNKTVPDEDVSEYCGRGASISIPSLTTVGFALLLILCWFH